jgi:DNA-binding LacI/PurR family transcriptional regulator
VRKVTLQDLAESLGVARSTVSRALRGDPQISVDTRERVRRLADQWGYAPNAAALALTRRRAGVIGLLLPRTSRFVFANPYFSELVEGIASVAEALGLPVLMSAEMRPDYAAWLREGRVDGLITLGSSLDTDQITVLEGLAARGSAIVLVHPAATATTLTTVATDEAPGLSEACHHLAEAGHHLVAIVAGPTRSPYAQSREAGWRGAAERAGMRVERVVAGDDTLASGREAARALLASGSAATAWLMGNDLMAFGALEALREVGHASGDHVAVVGFDDVLPAALVGLSTVHQPVREVGAHAMRALAGIMTGAAEAPSPLATRFVARCTTARPPVARVGAGGPGREDATRRITAG